MSRGGKFRLDSSSLCARLFREPDSRLVEGNHQVSVHELLVQLDQFLVGNFIQVLACTPVVIERLHNALRLVEGEVLINGTPCTVQSAGNPAIGKVRIRNAPTGLTEYTNAWQALVASPAKKSLPFAAGWSISL